MIGLQLLVNGIPHSFLVSLIPLALDSFSLLSLPFYLWEHISRLSGALDKNGSYQWVALPALVAMWAAEYWILKLFPRGTFAIGQIERRHQFFIYIRRTVIVGSLLSVLIRVLWVLFTKHP